MSNTSLPLNTPDQSQAATPLFKRLVNPLTLMLVLFGFPYIASWYFLDGDSSSPLTSLGNHGELVSPMVSLGDYSLPTISGNTLSSMDTSGNWLLVMATSSCQQTCQDNLLMVRQARKSAGVNRKVIQPILLLQSPDALTPFDVDLNQAFPQLGVVASGNSDGQFLVDTLAKVHADIENNIYMVDPYNNLMMVYPAGTTPKGLMADLKRLLKINKPNI